MGAARGFIDDVCLTLDITQQTKKKIDKLCEVAKKTRLEINSDKFKAIK